jgi:FK506-binding protein 4/5
LIDKNKTKNEHIRRENFSYLGEDLSEAKDQSIIRRTLTKGEGWTKPNDGARVEVTLKGTHNDRVFDERTLSFTIGEGFLVNVPEGFVLVMISLD